MKAMKKLAFLLVVMAAFEVGALAQGPLNKQVNYGINVPHRLRMQNYILPAGHYIIFQINQNNPNLFALYQDNMMHSPIALINTIRVDYQAKGYPEHAAIQWRIDESGSGTDPVITGWDIPGMSGWEITSVVPSNKGRNLMTRVR